MNIVKVEKSDCCQCDRIDNSLQEVKSYFRELSIFFSIENHYPKDFFCKLYEANSYQNKEQDTLITDVNTRKELADIRLDALLSEINLTFGECRSFERYKLQS